ncbi:MAG: rhombosortase [Gallionella sp.]|nr:rhombosortase [Gallionella sp.]
MAAQALLSKARLPVRTLAICAAALLVHFVPWLGQLLIYDRSAIAHGELWRLLTGNLVHLSDAHLAMDMAAFLIAGTMIEQRGYHHFMKLCISAAALIGMAIYLFEPVLQFYGGLSGVVTAAVVYLCLQGMTEQGSWRWLCAAMLAALSAKLWFELVSGKSLLLVVGGGNFVPVPLSHLTGAVVAVILFALLHLSPNFMPRNAARKSAA